MSVYLCPISWWHINQQMVKHPIRPALRSPVRMPWLNCPHVLPLYFKHPCGDMILSMHRSVPYLYNPTNEASTFEPFSGSSSRNPASNISSLRSSLDHWPRNSGRIPTHVGWLCMVWLGPMVISVINIQINHFTVMYDKWAVNKTHCRDKVKYETPRLHADEVIP